MQLYAYGGSERKKPAKTIESGLRHHQTLPPKVKGVTADAVIPALESLWFEMVTLS